MEVQWTSFEHSNLEFALNWYFHKNKLFSQIVNGELENINKTWPNEPINKHNISSQFVLIREMQPTRIMSVMFYYIFA